MQGLILINKPVGITSFGAVARIRHLTGIKKVGHTGTLDPMATGVLPIFIGRATALCDYLLTAQKSYTATVRLGVTTDTLDITGKVLTESPVNVTNTDVLNALNCFKGEIMQIPPAFSAIKQNGVRAYEKARKGEEVQIPPRKINIFEIEQTAPLKNDEFKFSCTVSKGTYIRSLVRDIGQKLGCGATLKELERTSTAGFNIKDTVDLDALTPDNIGKYILPADKAIPHIESVHITEKQKHRFCCGGQLSLDRIKVKDITDNKIYKVYYSDEFLGLGYIDQKNSQLAIKCVISEG